MKLYLSSFRFGNASDRLVALVGTNKKVAVIANSMDFTDMESRSEGVRREVDGLRLLGLEPEELDLRDYFTDNEGLRDKLLEFGVVWARGGNAFLLRRAMKYSGFDVLLTERLESDNDFLYGGYSAGIVILSPSLEGLDIVDDKDVTPSLYSSEVVWNGLSILGYSIAPHYDSDHPESAAINDVVTYFVEHEIPYRTLKDGEAIVIDGSPKDYRIV